MAVLHDLELYDASLRRPRYGFCKPGPAGLIGIQVSDGFGSIATSDNDMLENGNPELGVHVLDIGGICVAGRGTLGSQVADRRISLPRH